MLKRLFSFLLILCVCLTTVFPITAFASEPETGYSDSEAAQPESADDSEETTDEESEQPEDEMIDSAENSEEDSGEDSSLPEDDADNTDGEESGSEDAGNDSDEGGAEAETEADPLPVLPESEDEGDVTANAIAPLSEFEWGGGGIEYFTRIRLTATDREGRPVQDAAFSLYQYGNDYWPLEQLITDQNGEAVSSEIPAYFDYYLMEDYPPKGYHSNPERYDIKLGEFCAPSRVDVKAVYDPVMGQIKVLKTDETDNPIADVGFEVFRLNEWPLERELVDTIFTDQYGEACTIELPFSDWGYELYEFTAPEGFVSGDIYHTNIWPEGGVSELHIINYRASGSLRITKTGNDDQKLQGAVFSIHHGESDEWICDATTNSNGYAYAYNLPLGDYYAVEKSGVEGYVADTEKQHSFQLYYHGQTAYLNVVNDRAGQDGRVSVLTTDDGDNPLSDVVFGLYRAWDNKKLAELTTGSDGLAQYGPLIPQGYYLLEQAGKPGYTPVADRISFTIDGSGETVELTVVNSKIRIFGKVVATVKDDAGAPVSGVRVGVYCKWDFLLEELVTAEDGTATSGILNEGTGYFLSVLEGATGHLSNEEQHVFDITQDGLTVPVEIVTPRISGGVKVIKTGNDGEPLAGVEFGIYRGGKLVEKLVTQEDGTATSGTLYYGDYELVELATLEGYELLEIPIPFSVTEQDVVIEIPVSNPLIMGTITVKKVEDTPADSPKALPGAVFGLYNKQGQKLTELVTSEHGTASYTLPQGEFYLKELSAPEGFLVTDMLIPFAIETQGQAVEKVVVNKRGHGGVKVIKASDEGENSVPLSGVAFDVYTAAEEKVGELVTDENGEAVLALPLGRYFLVETATVEGFQLLPGRVSFALTEDGVTMELPIANQRIPAPEKVGIRLIKTNADGVPLAGAVFGVYDAGTEEKAGELISGPDGTASISLPAGDYYLLEQTAPEGYQLLDDKIPVTVTADEVTEISVENEPETQPTGELRIVKQASGTGQRLPGAMFGVYDADSDEKVGEITTGDNGVAGLALPAGGYYLLELAAPQGFQLDPKPVECNIVAGETLKLTIANDPDGPVKVPTGKVKFIKKAKDTGKALADAVIGVYKAGAKEKVAELTTGKDGVAEYELAVGDYEWKELRAPEGYALLEETRKFSVKADETTEITVVNEALESDTGLLLLIKREAGTGDPIADAVFGVYTKSNNRKVGEITTVDDGEAELALEKGDYYLKELSVPSPFVLEPTKIPFSIKKIGTTVKVEVSNTKGMGTVKLEKTDTEGEAVVGAVFTLYRRDGTRIAELTTRKDGTATYQLPVGSYYLVEKSVPEGYRLDTTRHSFTIKHGETATVKVVNELITGTVEVDFKDVSDGRELAEKQSLTTEPTTTQPTSGIELPKTGESFPWGTYALSLLCGLTAALGGVALYRRRRLLAQAAGVPAFGAAKDVANAVRAHSARQTTKAKKRRKKRKNNRKCK